MKYKKFLSVVSVLSILFGTFFTIRQLTRKERYHGIVEHEDSDAPIFEIMKEGQDITFPIWKHYNQSLPAYQNSQLTMEDSMTFLYNIGSFAEVVIEEKFDILARFRTLQKDGAEYLFYKGEITEDLSLSMAYMDSPSSKSLYFHTYQPKAYVPTTDDFKNANKLLVSQHEAFSMFDKAFERDYLPFQMYDDPSVVFNDNPFEVFNILFREFLFPMFSEFLGEIPKFDVDFYYADYYTVIYEQELLLVFQTQDIDYMLFYDITLNKITGFCISFAN